MDYTKISRPWFPYDSKSALDRHISARFAAVLKKGRAERDAIRTEDDLQKRQQFVRERFCTAMGIQLDDYPQPLSSCITGTTAYPHYSVENIILTMEPGVYMTGNLYLPEREAPHAAVLFLCGHSHNGRLYPLYLETCRTLVGAGLAVFAVDPTGQGERLNYYDAASGQPTVPPAVLDHDRAGCRGLVTGKCLAQLFLRDAMCAVSYLCSRPDIDASRIGVTGNSGGGTQTSMMMLADRRPAAFAPGTFIMDMGSMQRSGQAQDAEQIWPHFVSDGCDHADILLSCAPKPVLVLAAEYDFFPKEGTDATVEEARRYWELCGHPEAFDCATASTFHSYAPELQKAAARFFSKWLLGAETERMSLEPVDPTRCLCTKSGQVSVDFPDFRSVAQLYCDEAKTLRQPSGGEEWLREQVFAHRQPAKAMNLRPVDGRQCEMDGIRAELWMWQTQNDLFNCGTLLTPVECPRQPLTIAVWDGGTTAIADHGEWLDAQLNNGRSVLVVDLAGEGQLEPNPLKPGGGILNHYGTLYKLSCDLLMLDDSLAALRIYDLLHALDAAEHLPVYDGSGLHLYASGRSTLYARMAQKLDPRIRTMELQGGIPNYRDFLQEEPYDDTAILTHILPGMLRYFD